VEHLPLVLEAEQAPRLTEVDPARLGDLVGVVGDVAGDVAEQVEVHALVVPDALALRDVPVLDRAEGRDELARHARLLLDLPRRGGLRRLAGLDEALGELPAAVGETDQRHLPAAVDDAAGRHLSARGQAGHVASPAAGSGAGVGGSVAGMAASWTRTCRPVAPAGGGVRGC